MSKRRKFRVNKTKSVDSSGTNYEKWRDRGDGEQTTPEFMEANPDVLAEAVGMYYVSEAQSEQAVLVRELVKQAPQFLTAIQHRVFDGVCRGVAFHAIAEEMGRDVSTVFESWRMAQKKLQKKFAELSQ